MKTLIIIILVISIIGNIIGAYILYKAMKLKNEVKSLQRYHKDLTAKYEALKTDFSGASAYAEDNRRLLSETTPEQRRGMTIFFGASITRGWDLARYFPGQAFVNRGVGSQTDQQLLTRFPADVIQLNPGRVVIKFCSGNFRPGADLKVMWDAYEIMAMTARARGVIPILATVIPATRGAEEFADFSIAASVKEFNQRIRKLAAEQKFGLADYYKAMADGEGCLPDSLARDAIHPNENGYAVMAEVIKPVLE
ncbi:MAG: GDSL-type esterase/lipase family protein [candidate division Zixibacteria bacterium]|nr:GDSL-type esterase/lipase family protein [candidate division Zixibacteria bacterium]